MYDRSKVIKYERTYYVKNIYVEVISLISVRLKNICFVDMEFISNVTYPNYSNYNDPPIIYPLLESYYPQTK